MGYRINFTDYPALAPLIQALISLAGQILWIIRLTLEDGFAMNLI